MFVVFDLDGTLALNEHRAHFLEQEKKDWRAFYAACDGDLPNWPIIRTLHILDTGKHDVAIWSGRSDEVEDKTRAWLSGYGMGNIPLRMRQARDHQPDTKLKESWLLAEAVKPDLIFDDRASVVAMWRSHGIVCAQVAEGNF